MADTLRLWLGQSPAVEDDDGDLFPLARRLPRHHGSLLGRLLLLLPSVHLGGHVLGWIRVRLDLVVVVSVQEGRCGALLTWLDGRLSGDWSLLDVVHLVLLR